MGNSNKPLTEKICNILNLKPVNASIGRFNDNEINIEIKESIRGEDVFVIQSTSYPANDTLMELLVCCDALKRGSAKRITAVIPYFGYARQDRKQFSRSPISAKLVANLLTVSGINRILTMDLHAAQIQGFFDIPVDNLYSNIIFLDYIKNKIDIKNTVIVAPDVGGVGRARSLAKHLNCDLAIIDKRRAMAGVSEVMNIVGDVANKDCILIDDIADSAGTLCNAAEALTQNKAKSIKAMVTHGVFSANALQKIESSSISEFICTDSIYNPNHKTTSKITYLSIAEILAKSIKNINQESSLSSLFLN
jgi:ribose-phosphate pyrophosphokinase